MNLLNKFQFSSISMTTLSIACFFLSPSAKAFNEDIKVSNQSNQTILVQHTPINIKFSLESSRAEEFRIPLSFTSGEHWYSTTTLDSITTITSINNTPICTVTAHYFNPLILPIGMTMLSTDHLEKCRIKQILPRNGENPFETNAITITVT